MGTWIYEVWGEVHPSVSVRGMGVRIRLRD